MTLTQAAPRSPIAVTMITHRAARAPAASVDIQDTTRRTVQRCNYGIAIVFSLMLAVLVVAGSMLWSAP